MDLMKSLLFTFHRLYSWSHNSEKMTLRLYENKNVTDTLGAKDNPNGWLIVDSFASNYSIIVPENQYWEITEYVTHLKRKPKFQFYHSILPNTSKENVSVIWFQ